MVLYRGRRFTATWLMLGQAWLGCLASCSVVACSRPRAPSAQGPAQGRVASGPRAPAKKASVPVSPWLVTDPPNLRAVTVIVEVAPPPDIAATYSAFAAHHRDLRPLMEAHNEGGFGSGFAMVTETAEGPTGYIVTNQHVVGLSSQVRLGRSDSDARIEAPVIYVDPVYDLAIVGLSGDSARALGIERGLGFSDRIARDQDPVVASGFPGIEGDPSYQVTRGHVSNERVLIDIDGEELAHIQHTAPIDPGSSGGPLLDERSQVLGINTLKVRWREGVGLAVPASAIETALAAARAAPAEPEPRGKAQRSCELLLKYVASGTAWGRLDRLVGAKLVADEGSRSLWLLPEGDTDWLAEFVQDPARVMARAIGLRLEREMGVPAETTPVCEAQSSPTEETQRFLVTMGGSKRPLVFGEEQGTFKLLEYAFRPETGRSFLDPKPASKKKWTPTL
jgi:serine protease Do